MKASKIFVFARRSRNSVHAGLVEFAFDQHSFGKKAFALPVKDPLKIPARMREVVPKTVLRSNIISGDEILQVCFSDESEHAPDIVSVLAWNAWQGVFVMSASHGVWTRAQETPLLDVDIALLMSRTGAVQAFENIEPKVTNPHDFRYGTFWDIGDHNNPYDHLPVSSVDDTIFDEFLVGSWGSRFWVGPEFERRDALVDAVRASAEVTFHHDVACIRPSDRAGFLAAAAPYAAWGGNARGYVTFQS